MFRCSDRPTVPLASFTLIKCFALLRILRALERVLYWPEPGPLGMGVDTDEGEGPGSPAGFQLLLWWSSDTRDRGAGWCIHARRLSWGSFVEMSCSVPTRWYTLLVLSLRSLIMPVICLLISMPSSPSQTTLREKSVSGITEPLLLLSDMSPYTGTYHQRHPWAHHWHLYSSDSPHMTGRNLHVGQERFGHEIFKYQ